jgi:hypothetical protein
MITGTYNLAVSSEWRNLQEGEVFLECDTTLAPVTINLFEIAELQRFWNVKIVVSDPNNNAGTNNITINAGGSDTMDDSSTVQIVLNGNGESVALQVVSETQWLASESVGGGGSSAPIDVDYATLYDKIVNSQLIAGSKYRLLNYQSANFLNGWNLANSNPTPIDPSFDPRAIYIGEKEQLILEAISSFELAPVAYSESYQGDILEFQAYTNRIGVNFDIYTGATLPDSTVVADFNLKWDATNNEVYFDMPTGYPALFGHYFYLYAEFNGGSAFQDGVFEPLTPVISRCQYDFNSVFPMSNLSVSSDGTRVVMLDLKYNDFLNYDINTLNVTTIYAIGDAYGCVTRRTDTERSVTTPFDFRGRKYRRYEIEAFGQIEDFSYVSTGTTALDNVYWSVVATNVSSNGVGATFRVVVSGGGVTNLTFMDFGANYVVGDVIKINGNQIGGVNGVDDIEITLIKVYSNVGFYGIGDNPTVSGVARTTTGAFADSFIFNGEFYNIEWLGIGGYDAGYYAGYNDNNVFQGVCVYNKFSDEMFNNTFRSCNSSVINTNYFTNNIWLSCNLNTFFGAVFDNVVGTGFQGNEFRGIYFYGNVILNDFLNNKLLGEFTQNRVGIGFQYNFFSSYFINNTIGYAFYNNRFLGDAGNNSIQTFFQFNTFQGRGFSGNNIATDFTSNNIFKDFEENEFGLSAKFNNFSQAFRRNSVSNDFRSNYFNAISQNGDFRLSTLVYQDYTKTIFSLPNGTLQLSYVDNSNTVVYAFPTA